MAYDLSAISSEARLQAPRIILLGVEKIGKTTFAAGADTPILMPIKGEEGADALQVAKTPTCNTMADLLGWIYAIYEAPNQYGTIILDSASALEPLVWADTCQRNGQVESIEKVGGGYGKGYIEALRSWRQITEALDAMRSAKGMASIVIGHVKVKRFDDPAGDSYDQYQFDINDKAANLLFRWADVILFCNTKVIVRKEDVGFKKQHKTGIDIAEGQRFLYTQKRPAHPGGGRGVYGRLPYELPLSWTAFRDAVSAASS
jgi:hypothetical protein